MTRHVHADLMIALAEDSSIEIEILINQTVGWCRCTETTFYESSKYRIKQKEKKKVIKWQWICQDALGVQYTTTNFYENASEIIYTACYTINVIKKAEWTRTEFEVTE
jgi:hypothetical protein